MKQKTDPDRDPVDHVLHSSSPKSKTLNSQLPSRSSHSVTLPATIPAEISRNLLQWRFPYKTTILEEIIPLQMPPGLQVSSTLMDSSQIHGFWLDWIGIFPTFHLYHSGNKRSFGDLEDDEDDIFGSKKVAPLNFIYHKFSFYSLA